MRTSINDPYASEDAYSGTDIGDFQAVDNTSGVFVTLVNLFIKMLWLLVVILGLAALSFPYLFPDWAQNYKKELQEMGIAANTGRFLKNAKKVDWKAAFSEVNLANLYLI